MLSYIQPTPNYERTHKHTNTQTHTINRYTLPVRGNRKKTIVRNIYYVDLLSSAAELSNSYERSRTLALSLWHKVYGVFFYELIYAHP